MTPPCLSVCACTQYVIAKHEQCVGRAYVSVYRPLGAVRQSLHCYCVLHGATRCCTGKALAGQENSGARRSAGACRHEKRNLRSATGGLTDNNSFSAAQAYGVRRLYRHVACYDFWKPSKWNMRAHLFTGAGSSSTTGS